jgi:hypothetical protein
MSGAKQRMFAEKTIRPASGGIFVRHTSILRSSRLSIDIRACPLFLCAPGPVGISSPSDSADHHAGIQGNTWFNGLPATGRNDT